MLTKLEKRRTEVSALLSSAHLISDSELQKEFREINLEAAIANLNTVIVKYSDFPKSVERAKSLLSGIQDAYLKKKIVYLEAKEREFEAQKIGQTRFHGELAIDSDQKLDAHHAEPLEVTASLAERLSPEVIVIEDLREDHRKTPDWNAPFDPASMSSKMSAWLPVERALYETWNGNVYSGTPEEFYEQQFAESMTLKGIVESYARSIKNKPGDYLLVNATSRLPIAYLYSTRVDLQDCVGKEVTLHAIGRPNNNFAFPAYFVIALE
jgi:hypothetical protein